MISVSAHRSCGHVVATSVLRSDRGGQKSAIKPQTSEKYRAFGPKYTLKVSVLVSRLPPASPGSCSPSPSVLLSLKHCASCTSFAYTLSLQAHTQETALYGRIVRVLRVHLCSVVALWRPFGGVGDSLTTKTHISTRRHPPGNGGYMMVLSRFDSRFDLLVLVTRPKYQGKILHNHSHHHVARRIDDNPRRWQSSGHN